MKKIILLAATITAFTFNIKAQTTGQLVSNFKTLLAEANSDFKKVKGAILENDSINKNA